MRKFLSMMADSVTVTKETWWNGLMKPIIDGIDIALIPIIIIVASAGMIYAIWLGIQLAKAESADAREEAKKKMIYFIIAFVVTIILLVLLKLLSANADNLYNMLSGVHAGPSEPATTGSVKG